MTTETRKRIRAYKKALPELRERVIAVALLLAMSASMLGSASFAWITLSRSPEITGMQTTVAANGNLEIALAQGTVADGMNPPQESQVGDSSSSLRENWGITQANATWGNLVNLSDPQYGLDKIVLRPSLLSSYGLDNSPLHGASYGQDGRVIDTIQQYGYASLKDIGDGDYQFTAGDDVQYGVRAVSSMRVENTVGANRLAKFESETNKHYGNAIARYKALVSDGETGSVTATKFYDKIAVTALEGMVSTFAQNKVDDGDDSYANYIWYLHQMMIELRAIMLEHEALGLLEMANWQAYVKNGNVNDKTFESFDQLVENKDSLSDYGVKLTTLDAFLADLKVLNECIDGMQEMADACHPQTGTFPDIKWATIEPYINKMVDLSTATLEANSLEETRVYNLGISNATGLMGEKNAKIRVKKGVIYNFEDRVGIGGENTTNGMYAHVAVSVSVSILTVTVEGHVFTTADKTPNYVTDMNYSKSLDNSGASGQKYAKDTYGMAIDVWVRTNAPDSVLVLEGTTIFEDVDVTFKDSNNNTVYVYELKIPVDDGEETYDIYQNPADNKWYYYGSDTEVPSEALNQGTREKKQEKRVTGFRGENRIWEDWEALLENGYIAEDATTQGAGSCFIFYADTPAEQAKLMEMMHAFTITFINAAGDAVATATLDTENAYINQGKITAPLVIGSGIAYVDESGTERKGIMALTQNEATWLTALIYLNGELLNNDNVLADSSIIGQLNLQFGTNAKLDVRNDEELQMQYRTITAEAVSVEDSSQTSSNSEEVIEYEYAAEGHEVTVNLTVEGDQPERISGFFVRVINETQGTRGDELKFDPNGDGTWSATFTLKSPGTYVMNTVMVDGIEYRLKDKTQGDKGNHPTVLINGLKLENVRTSHLSGTYMTDQKSIQVGVYAKIEADAALNPKSVQAQFFSADGSKQYSGQLKFNPNNEGGMWEGTVSLNSSGTYYLRYLIIDGIPVEVSATSQTRLECYMGLYCTIICQQPERDFLYQGQAFNLTMRAVIMDDNDHIMQDLEGVHLYYHSDGSSDDDQGMHAPLTWDASGQWYTGTFELGTPGTYSFNRLSIGSSELTSARSAPVFTASTPVPPSWDAGSAAAKARQLGLDSSNPATLSLRLKDAASATVWAELENTETGETITVQNSSKTTVGDVHEFGFKLTKDGTWQLKRVLCQGVYNGTTPYPVGGASYYEIAVPEADQVVTQVVCTIQADLYYNGTKYTSSFTQHFGAEQQSDGTYKVTGALFQAYTPSIEVKITDGSDAAFLDSELTSVVWNITHSATNMLSFGGYTGYNYSQMEPKKMTLKSGETATYVSPAVTMDLAGEYISSVTATFDLGDGKFFTYEVPVKPQFNVYSVKPTVTITGVSPAASSHNDIRIYTSEQPTSAGDLSAVTFNSINRHTSNSAAVYMYALGGGTGLIDTEAAHPYQPKVTLSMSGMSTNITSAKMIFAHSTNSAYDAKFDFVSSNGIYTATSSIGGFTDGETNIIGVSKWPVIYPAGTATVNAVTVVYGGNTFTVNLTDSITISNMLAPNVYADLTVNESSYSGAKRIYSVDGETITLPNTTWSTTGIDTGADATVSAWSQTTVHTDYSYRTYKQYYVITKNEYMPYAWTKFTRTITGSQTPYTINYKIQKWVVNGVEYDVSNGPITIPADSAIKATAVVTSSKVLGSTVTTTTTETLYGYVKGSQTSSKPSGKQIGATVTSSGGAFIEPTIGIANINTGAHVFTDAEYYKNCENRAK